MKRPELLAPAGDLERMRAAYDFGADAVYAGQPRYSLRARNNDFTMQNLAQGIEEAHARGKLFFVASNLMPHNAKVKTYLADMEPVIAPESVEVVTVPAPDGQPLPCNALNAQVVAEPGKPLAPAGS